MLDGKIKVKHIPEGISGFGSRESRLKDGTAPPAGAVVRATRYDSMRMTVREVLGDKLADRCTDVWDLKHEL